MDHCTISPAQRAHHSTKPLEAIVFPIVFVLFFPSLVGFGSGNTKPLLAFAAVASCPPLPFFGQSNQPNLSSNGDLNLDTGLDVDNDLLDDLGGGGQVDKALVDAHLEEIPGLGTLTARGLAGLFCC